VAPKILGLSQASGVVPTPYGNIEIRWEDRPSEKEFIFNIKHPKECVPKIKMPAHRKVIHRDV
jgi:hypothetical protein